MAVTLDATGTLKAGNALTSPQVPVITVGSGSNRALILCVSTKVVITGLAATWNGVSLSLIKSQANGTNCFTALMGLVAPASGAQTLSVSWSGGATDLDMLSLSFAGVNQTGGVTSFPNATSATGSTTPAAVTITSATNDYTISCATTNGNVFTSPTQTQTYADGSLDTISGMGSRAVGAATVTHSWTAPAGQWTIVGCDLADLAASLPQKVVNLRQAVVRASTW